MNIREISKPVTAKSLNESLAKKFGQKVNIDAFTLEQLEDARNKIRTKLSQVETNESFDTVVNDEGYQKSKLFLDVLNAAISEREDIDEGAKPDYIDIDGDGDKEEPMKKAAKDAKKKKKKKVDEIAIVNNEAKEGLDQALQVFRQSEPEKAKQLEQFMTQIGYTPAPSRPNTRTGSLPSTNLGDSVIREGAEDEAELVMAAKDMVDRVTGWMEDTAEMQTESMLELADAIRDEMGSEKSEAFTASIKPALESLYSAMESTRGTLTSGVGMLTGEEMPMGDDAMGADMPADDMSDPGMEPIEDPLAAAAADDGMDAAPAAAGGEEEAGRAKRESVRRPKKKLAERSRKIGTILSKKKS